MGGAQSLHDVGDRIERLLAEVRSTASPSVAERVDELMRSTVELYGAGLARVMDILAASGHRDDVLAALAKDDLVASLLILHGLHPQDFAARVHNALEKVRPYLGSHGGGVEIAEADERTGVVRLRMQGSCDGCPSSAITVKLAVEGAIREMAPEVQRIEVEGMPESSNGNGHHRHASSASSWIRIDSTMAAGASVSASKAAGAQIVLCRLDGVLYAYRDACPSCGAAMSAGILNGNVLACPSCESEYDIRLAGRAIDASGPPLEPLPLLESDEGVSVAVSSM
jgi:Fe-S cluster biogenesis protein NfuA/nitrite reductase/ring-hydroxylating ferredoxin subunit